MTRLVPPTFPGRFEARQPRRLLRCLPIVLLSLAGCSAQGGGDDFLTTLLQGPKVDVPRGSFLELSISDSIPEGPSQSPFAAFGAGASRSLWDLRRALRAAAVDERIAGLKLEIEMAPLGFGMLEELGALLDRFRESGKPVYAYLRGDFVEDGGYLLAVAADRVYVAPAAALLVNGLRAEVTFWRGTLEKLGVVPHVLMFKEYKSAGEPFARHSMSEAFRESLRDVLGDLEERLASRISQRRGLPPIQVRAGLDMGMMTTGEALATGWIDALGQREAVEADLARTAKTDGYNGIELKKYIRAIDRKRSGFGGLDFKSLRGAEPPVVAVIFGEGPIVAAEQGDPFESLFGGAQLIRGLSTARAIDEAAEDPEVRAIVFRVNSPGGSAVGSDHVHDAVRRARQAGKKVVVSMGSVAGSGGYWVSMGADRIVAQPSTITGSIGVVMTQFDVRGFYEWIGAHVDTVSVSRGSGVLSTVEDFDESRKERWSAWMTAVYDDFKRQVAEGRGLQLEQVEDIARGRIWSGVAASKNGLVDELGGLDEAVAQACKLAKLGDPERVRLEVYPKKDSVEAFFQELFGVKSVSGVEHLARGLLQPEVIRQLARPRVLVQLPHILID
jgi:protease IV